MSPCVCFYGWVNAPYDPRGLNNVNITMNRRFASSSLPPSPIGICSPKREWLRGMIIIFSNPELTVLVCVLVCLYKRGHDKNQKESLGGKRGHTQLLLEE